MGNGKASAIVYAREGAKVMLVDLNLKAAEETKSIIDKEGGTSFAYAADVSKANESQKLTDTCVQKFGRIDVLHNNVGIIEYGGALDTTEQSWDKQITVNLKSQFLMCKSVIPYMLKQGKGAIINISSLSGIRTQPFPAIAYSTSKAGVIALTHEIALEFAAKGIRCNCILPGVMKTPMVAYYQVQTYAGGDVEEMWRRRDSISPTGKQGEPWDVAYAALFLASDEAKYVNGVELLVDGGLCQTVRTFSK
jgi:NAD(P)-dependent dehydrogenase (short-subunit alcohol dehydrogenase family)